MTPATHPAFTHLRTDLREEVADHEMARREFGCREDLLCVLLDRHAGECTQRREHEIAPGALYPVPGPSGARETVLAWVEAEMNRTEENCEDDEPSVRDFVADIIRMFHTQVTCERHGGQWGEDETCVGCTLPDGSIRPF